jgi:hypothetical protein
VNRLETIHHELIRKNQTDLKDFRWLHSKLSDAIAVIDFYANSYNWCHKTTHPEYINKGHVPTIIDADSGFNARVFLEELDR